MELAELKRRARTHDVRGELEAAIECRTACFERTEGGIEEVHWLVEALLRANRTEDAIRVARECTERHPQQPTAFYILGRALRISWRFEESVSAFSEACRLRPGWSLSETGLKQARRQLEASPEARQRRIPILHRFEALHGRQVVAGPFRGLRFPTHVDDVTLLSQLSGLYEPEIQPDVESLLSLSPPRIINIGGANGYYALGMALRLPEAHVHVYELDPICRDRIRAGAEANACSDRITIHGLCTADDLAELLQPGDLVLSDCEGAELSLLRPDRIEALRDCTLLVELHDFIFRDATRVMSHRFGDSHRIRIVPANETPEIPELAVLESFTAEELRIMSADLRPEGMAWAIMTPCEDPASQ